MSNAISPNGYIARDDGQEDWLPSEGWSEFLIDAKRFNNFVMGRQTFELVTKLYPDYNFDNVDVDLKVIVTSVSNFKAPAGYTAVHSPEKAIEFIKSKGQSEVLLIGGGKLNSAFLKKRLIDEMWLTINPHIIGKGRPFLSPDDFEVDLDLLGFEQLSKGRVQVRYAIKK